MNKGLYIGIGIIMVFAFVAFAHIEVFPTTGDFIVLGKLGIGTNDPQSDLHVNGTAQGRLPTANNHFATKGYVDAMGGSGSAPVQSAGGGPAFTIFGENSFCPTGYISVVNGRYGCPVVHESGAHSKIAAIGSCACLEGEGFSNRYHSLLFLTYFDLNRAVNRAVPCQVCVPDLTPAQRSMDNTRMVFLTGVEHRANKDPQEACNELLDSFRNGVRFTRDFLYNLDEAQMTPLVCTTTEGCPVYEPNTRYDFYSGTDHFLQLEIDEYGFAHGRGSHLFDFSLIWYYGSYWWGINIIESTRKLNYISNLVEANTCNDWTSIGVPGCGGQRSFMCLFDAPLK